MEEFVKKKDITDVLQRMVDLREKKRNCSRSSAIEYQAFKYCIAIINQAVSYKFNETDSEL